VNHKKAIDQLRREGFGVDDNPDLMDVLHTTSPVMPAQSARMQSRYWELMKKSELMLRPTE